MLAGFYITMEILKLDTKKHGEFMLSVSESGLRICSKAMKTFNISGGEHFEVATENEYVYIRWGFGESPYSIKSTLASNNVYLNRIELKKLLLRHYKSLHLDLELTPNEDGWYKIVEL